MIGYSKEFKFIKLRMSVKDELSNNDILVGIYKNLIKFILVI